MGGMELWVVNLSFGADGVAMKPGPVAKFDKPAVRIMFQVTPIVRFLPERALWFRNHGSLRGSCGRRIGPKPSSIKTRASRSEPRLLYQSLGWALWHLTGAAALRVA
jgi:hypothetical protein